jgi:transposase-like protein
VVGAVERTPERRFFAVPVERRDAETLNRVISENIAPGSIIYSDCWRGYRTDDWQKWITAMKLSITVEISLILKHEFIPIP